LNEAAPKRTMCSAMGSERFRS